MTATIMKSDSSGFSRFIIATDAEDTLEFDIGLAEKMTIHSLEAFVDTVEFQLSALKSPSADADWVTITNNSGVNPWEGPGAAETLAQIVKGFAKGRIKRTGLVAGALEFHVNFD